MLEGHYAGREPRVHVAAASAAMTRRRLLFLRAPRQDADALLDLSLTGMKILAHGAPPAAGDRLDIELGHPAVKGTVHLEGEVRWVRPEPGREGVWGAGIQFQRLRDTTRVALERLIVLELGSMVQSGLQGHLGYVAHASGAHLEGTWFVYDVDRRELARIEEEPLYYRVTRSGDDDERPRARDVESFQEALRWVFDVPTRLDVEPPLHPAPKRP